MTGAWPLGPLALSSRRSSRTRPSQGSHFVPRNHSAQLAGLLLPPTGGGPWVGSAHTVQPPAKRSLQVPLGDSTWMNSAFPWVPERGGQVARRGRGRAPPRAAQRRGAPTAAWSPCFRSPVKHHEGKRAGGGMKAQFFPSPNAPVLWAFENVLGNKRPFIFSLN